MLQVDSLPTELSGKPRLPILCWIKVTRVDLFVSVPYLRGNVFRISSLSMMVVGLLYTAFIMLRYIPPTFTLWKVFFFFFKSQMNVEFCHQIFFCSYWDNQGAILSIPQRRLFLVCSLLCTVSSCGRQEDKSLSLLVSIVFPSWVLHPHQFSSVTQSRLTFYNPMDCRKPDFPVQYQLLELAQTHGHWISDAIPLPQPLLLLPTIFPSIRVFFSESVLGIRWPSSWPHLNLITEFPPKYRHTGSYASSVWVL